MLVSPYSELSPIQTYIGSQECELIADTYMDVGLDSNIYQELARESHKHRN
jgi:hypothetical protein